MVLFNTIFALTFFLFGCVAVAVSKNDIQIIVAVLNFGFGSIVLSLAFILSAIRKTARPLQ